MNNLFLENIKKSLIWNKSYKDLDDFMENGFFKCEYVPEFPKAVTNIVRTGDLLKNSGEKFFEKYGLSVAQKNVLEALYLSGKKYMTQKDLAVFVYTSKANISSLLKRMEDKGLILRKDNSENRREKKVYLTNKGRNLFFELFSDFGKFDIENVISDDEARVLNEILNKLRHGFKNMEVE